MGRGRREGHYRGGGEKRIVTGLYEIMTMKLLKIVKHCRISLVAQLAKNLPTMWESWVRSLRQEDSLEKGMAVFYTKAPVFLPGE